MWERVYGTKCGRRVCGHGVQRDGIRVHAAVRLQANIQTEERQK